MLQVFRHRSTESQGLSAFRNHQGERVVLVWIFQLSCNSICSLEIVRSKSSLKPKSRSDFLRRSFLAALIDTFETFGLTVDCVCVAFGWNWIAGIYPKNEIVFLKREEKKGGPTKIINKNPCGMKFSRLFHSDSGVSLLKKDTRSWQMRCSVRRQRRHRKGQGRWEALCFDASRRNHPVPSQSLR